MGSRGSLGILAFVVLFAVPLFVCADAPAFTLPKQYSADLVFGTGDKTQKVKVYRDGYRVRMEPDPTRYSVLLTDQNVICLVSTADKTYSSGKMDPADMAPLLLISAGPDDTCKFESTGTETVSGVDCIKYKVTPAKGPSLNFWIDSKSHLPVKAADDSGSFAVAWNNIQAGAPDAALFAVPPAGYTVVISPPEKAALMQREHAIGISIFSYANDNNGAYPAGKTSTEVFQKLVDGGYVTDPTIFYIPMDGKSPATSNKLTADNVCFDFTSGLAADSPDSVPELFTTGYIVSYTAGAAAKPAPGTKTSPLGMAVARKAMDVSFLPPNADGTVSNFVPPDFNAAGKTYQQLRP